MAAAIKLRDEAINPTKAIPKGAVGSGHGYEIDGSVDNKFGPSACICTYVRMKVPFNNKKRYSFSIVEVIVVASDKEGKADWSSDR